MGVHYWLDEQLQTQDGLEAAQAALADDLAQADAVYLTVCLDVLPGAQAPGVSAPSPLGVPLAQVERLVDQVLASGRLSAADVAELNPTQDRDDTHPHSDIRCFSGTRRRLWRQRGAVDDEMEHLLTPEFAL